MKLGVVDVGGGLRGVYAAGHAATERGKRRGPFVTGQTRQEGPTPAAAEFERRRT